MWHSTIFNQITEFNLENKGNFRKQQKEFILSKRDTFLDFCVFLKKKQHFLCFKRDSLLKMYAYFA